MAVSDNTAFGSIEVPYNGTRNFVKSSIGKHNLRVPSSADFKPFLYKTVEELSKVKSIQFWKNDKVRVIGRIFIENGNNVIEAQLLSPLNTCEKTMITLDMDFMECRHSRGKLVEVFGYFYMDSNDEPQLKAVHIAPANGVNIQSHYKVIKLRNKYVPDYND